MPLSCCYVRIVLFFPLICWGFCSQKLCTPEPYYKLEVSRKKSCCLLFFFFLFPLFSFGRVVGLRTNPSEHYSALLWNTETHRFSKIWPLILLSHCHFTILNRCVFVAPALTGTPPRWFISPVGLLAAAGDQTEEPGLSHQGNESEKREGGEEHYCLSAACLCSQATLCPHLSMPYIQMNPISAFTSTHCSQTFSSQYI